VAEPDPNKPQVTDPATVADLVRILSVRGALGVLDVADIIIPTISVGSLSPLQVQIRQPVFRSVDAFSAGLLIAAGANTVHADTTALPAGDYDVQVHIQPTANLVGPLTLDLEHRDAADAANLAVLAINLVGSGMDVGQNLDLTFGYTLANDERLRVINPNAFGGTVRSYAVIWARLRT